MACPAAGALPRAGNINPFSEKGTDMHAFFRDAWELGRDAALERVRPELREICAAAPLEAIFAKVPRGAKVWGELALAYDVETEAVRFLGEDIGRAYDKDGPLGEHEIALTLDVAADGALAFAGDFKTGRGRVPPIRRNMQMRTGGLVLARWLKKEGALIVLTQAPDGQSPAHEVDELDGFDLDSIAADLRLMAQRVRNERELVKSGQTGGTFPLRAVTGDHCKYCPSFNFCPAQTALVRQMAADPKAVARSIMEKLAAGEVSQAYRKWREARAVLGAIGEAFVLRAQAEPIEIGDGWFYGPHNVESQELDPEKTWEVLSLQHGPEVAKAAMTLETSKAGVGRAVKVAQAEMEKVGKKVTQKELNERALSAIEKAGGVKTKTKTRTEEFKK
jgi:hypothetical protein